MKVEPDLQEMRDKHFKKTLDLEVENTNKKIRSRQSWRKHKKAMYFRLKGIFILFVIAMIMMIINALNTPTTRSL